MSKPDGLGYLIYKVRWSLFVSLSLSFGHMHTLPRARSSKALCSFLFLAKAGSFSYMEILTEYAEIRLSIPDAEKFSVLPNATNMQVCNNKKIYTTFQSSIICIYFFPFFLRILPVSLVVGLLTRTVSSSLVLLVVGAATFVAGTAAGVSSSFIRSV